MEFEDILKQVGGYGKYQRKLTILFVIPVSFIIPWFWMDRIFLLSVPDHWCYVPELMSTNLSTEQQRAIISPPDDPSCSMYQLNYTQFTNTDITYYTPNHTDVVPCTQGWQYDREKYHSTASTKWNLVCSYSHYPSLVFTLSNVGSLLGTPIYGFISDKVGRKKTFLVLAVIVSSTAIASVLAQNFVIFAVLRTINGTVTISLFSLYYILIIELIAPNMRAHMYGIIHIFWTLGLCALSLIAFLSRSWIILGLVTSFAGFFMLCYWRFIPESPCWLLSQNRCEEACVILMQIGKENGKPQDKETILKQLMTLSEKNKIQKEKESQDPEFRILKYHRLRRTFLILCFCWTASNVAYEGMFYNIRNLSGNEFLNFFLLSVVEFPGSLTFWYLISHIGRRWTATFGYFAVAVVCLMPLIDFPLCDIVSSIIGKFLITGAYMVTDQHGSELFPTVKRLFGVGTAKTVATAITLLVPYIADLSVYGRSIPFLFISSTSLIASVLACFLPETLNKNLPQTISDAEDFGKDQKFFSWNRDCKQKNDKTQTQSTRSDNSEKT